MGIWTFLILAGGIVVFIGGIIVGRFRLFPLSVLIRLKKELLNHKKNTQLLSNITRVYNVSTSL